MFWIGDAEWSVCHVTEDVFCLGQNLGGFCAVDAVEVCVVFKAVFAVRGEDCWDAFDCGGVGDCSALVVYDAVCAEVEFEFASVVGRDYVTMGAEAWSGGVVFRF